MKFNSSKGISCGIGIFWQIGKRYKFNTIGITLLNWSGWIEF